MIKRKKIKLIISKPLIFYKILDIYLKKRNKRIKILKYIY